MEERSNQYLALIQKWHRRLSNRLRHQRPSLLLRFLLGLRRLLIFLLLLPLLLLLHLLSRRDQKATSERSSDQAETHPRLSEERS